MTSSHTLVGLDVPEELLPDLDDGSGKHESFLHQLADVRPTGVVDGVGALLDDWIRLGGTLEHGSSSETSCFRFGTQSAPTRFCIWTSAAKKHGGRAGRQLNCTGTAMRVRRSLSGTSSGELR